jgi:non-heme chloroperoxidase
MPTRKRRAMAKKDIFYDAQPYAISYEILNPSASETLVFLHGWGSNKETMKHAFSPFFKQYKHLYIDLPGFGASSLEKVIDTHAYASLISTFLHALGIVPYAVFGHSFGGKIATLLNPPKLVLLSTAGIVVEKSSKVKLKIALFKCFKPFLPQRFYRFFATKDVKGMNQTMYEVLKKVVNEDFTEDFRQCTSQSFIFWGKDDSATPLSSGQCIASLLQDNHFFTLEGDHFFFITKGYTIEKLLLESDF